MHLNALFKAGGRLCSCIPKIVLVMQLTCIILLAACLQVSAAAYGQKVTIVEKNVSLKEVFKEIRKQTGYNFIYSNKTILEANPVSLNAKKADIREVLDVCFAGQPLTYTIEDKIIIVKKKPLLPVTRELPGKVISGQVTDSATGQPLAGVTIQVRDSNTGTVTDAKGMFSLEVPDGAVLVVSYLGYAPREIPVRDLTNLEISLTATATGLNQLVVVGYGTQHRESVTGAISQISGKELLKAPAGNITNMLGGLVPGVIALQESGQPGADGASILVRGAGAKYIVDGVERSISEIDPNEIASVSVLKDAASASVYGLDANAVIIITTKRGEVSPPNITFSGAYGVSTNAAMLQMLDGPGYAYWYNKAREMDGDDPVFSSAQIEKMLNNDPTDGWGNTNWYKKTFGMGSTMDLNVSATGGSKKAKYFVFLGNYNQDGNVKNFDYNRINLRTNLDVVIANNLDLRFDVAGRLENRQSPFYSASPFDWNNIPQQAIRALPFVPEEMNGLPVSTRTASSYVNPLAAADLSGYNKAKTNLVQTNFALQYNTPFIEGLSLKFLAAYDASYQTTKAYSTPFYTEVANNPTSQTADISYVKTYDARGTTASLTEGSSYSTRLTTNLSMEYDRHFDAHHISALALMETVRSDGNQFGAYGYGFDILALDELDFATLKEKNSVSGSSYTQRKAGFLGRVGYDYASKYLAEVSLRYDGSYVFGGMVKGKRWSPFPAASLGWRMSEEDWFRQSVHFVDDLKIRGSVGLTGTTEIPAYYYLNTLSVLNPAVVIGGVAQSGLLTSQPGNINLTWAKALQYNAGFDATLWHGFLGINFDVFYKYIYDMLSPVSATYPPSYGGYVYGYANNNKQDHKGFEFVLSHEHKIGSFSYKISFNGTYTRRRWLKYSDSENTPDWLKLTGKEVGAQVGFIAEGLFQSQDEIDHSALIEGKAVRVGDIKYKDRNGDGVISYEQDRGYIGKSSYPDFVGGVVFNGQWKNLDFSFMIQGALGRDVALTGVYPGGIMDNTSMTKAFYHDGNSPRYLVENSWTEDNKNAEFPRLTIVAASSNNAFSSTFWYRNGDYARLKTMQIGYTFPHNWIKVAGINALRLHVEGQNLLTLSHLTKYNIDPEQPGVSNGYYPQQRVFTVGVKLTF
jgi:TonB-linked SusC/RagA family outer membrane protein